MHIKTQAELDWERKYGHMTESELQDVVKASFHKKLEAVRVRAEQEWQEYNAKYNLPYGQLVQAIRKTEEQIEEIEEVPEKLLTKKRKELEKVFEQQADLGWFDKNNKELWVAGQIVEYMRSEEYLQAKYALQDAKNDLEIYYRNKSKWEEENADIIKAERIRTKRAELLQADPEALRALGIEPEAIVATNTNSNTDDGKNDLRSALRSIHPSATDAEIEGMLKSYGECS